MNLGFRGLGFRVLGLGSTQSLLHAPTKLEVDYPILPAQRRTEISAKAQGMLTDCILLSHSNCP